VGSGEQLTVGQRGRRGWGRPRTSLDPLAALLRQRYTSRAELARASGLPYQLLRTYTDGLWTADHLPPVRVLAALSQAVDPTELQRAVREAMLVRTDQSQGPPSLTWGQRVLLEALRGFDDDIMIEAAPHVHDLLTTFAAEAERPADRAPATLDRPADAPR
jgi:hypothetical protein